MSKVIPTEERLAKARKLLEQARNIPQPEVHGWDDLEYAAKVKETLRQANDLIKFISMTVGPSAELKAEAGQLMKEITAAEKEILHRSA